MSLRKMVRVSLVLVGLCLSWLTNMDAQMTPAKLIAPKVIKGVSLSDSTSEVWNFLTSPETFYSAMEEAKNVSCPNVERGAKVSLSLPMDKHREQVISVIDEQALLLTYFITQTSYYDKPIIYRFLVGADEENAYVQFEAIFKTGDIEEDKRIERLVIEEWGLVKKVLENKFN